MTSTTSIRTRILTAGAAAALLTAPSIPAAVAAPSGPETAAVQEDCAGPSGERVLLRDGGSLPDWVSPTTGETVEPNLEFADTSGFDACADLSWITVQYGNATHSPQHILLYHGTEYLGTATSEPQPYLPQIESTGGDTLTADYPYAAPGQDPATANPRGNAVSIFTWDEATQSVVHEGDFPPGA